MTTKRFTYIWEYRVKKECLGDFKRIYGTTGDWVQLFRKANGYITTELHQDISNPMRFLTIDYWNSKDDRDNFRSLFSYEFGILDERCQSLTELEKFMGDFHCETNRFLNQFQE